MLSTLSNALTRLKARLRMDFSFILNSFTGHCCPKAREDQLYTVGVLSCIPKLHLGLGVQDCC